MMLVYLYRAMQAVISHNRLYLYQQIMDKEKVLPDNKNADDSFSVTLEQAGSKYISYKQHSG